MIEIIPGKVKGRVALPGSKSYTNRALVISALAEGKSVLRNPLICDDTNYLMSSLRACGARINVKGSTVTVYGGRLHPPGKPLFLGESGTGLRFMLSLAALLKGKTQITGMEGLMRRPLSPLASALRSLGAEIDSSLNVSGPLTGGRCTMPGGTSSQFISSILIAAPYAKKDVAVEVQGSLVSRPYVDATLQVMKSFGVSVSETGSGFYVRADQRYSPREYAVEGDASSASYFFAAAAIAGSVSVDMNRDSLQPDWVFPGILEKMGAIVSRSKDAITVSAHGLKGIDVSMKDCPDIVPTMCAVAVFARGKTVIRDISHLRLKESDRIESILENMKRLGIRAEYSGSCLVIYGGKPRPAVLESFNDHRIAMAFSLIGLRSPGTRILNPGTVSKSFPQYWKALEKIGVKTITPNIYLVGYRASGKTTVSGHLGRMLGRKVVSLDRLTERKTRGISRFVEKKGWPAFRRMESIVLSTVSKKSNRIVDCGGGIVERGQNIRIMKRTGSIYYLKASPETIKNRLMFSDNSHRPSLTGKDIIDEINNVLKKRIPLYMKADFTIDTGDMTPIMIAKEISENEN